MIIQNFKNSEELAIQTEVLLLKVLKNSGKNKIRGFLPTGRSAEPFYELLRKKKSFWSDKLEVIQIDEFIGNNRLFFNTLKEQVLEPLHLLSATEDIQPNWSDEEMQSHIAKVLSKPIDFAILGLGPNGHVGFHEPHIQLNPFYGGKVFLSDSSYQRVAGAPSQWALTFGAASFMKAKTIILIATGANKIDIFQKFVEGSTNPQIPATLLKDHADLQVLTDLKISKKIFACI